MIMPINCPKCRDPMINEFMPTSIGKSEYLKKSCTKRLDHNIIYISYPGMGDLVFQFSLKFQNSRATWFPHDQCLLIQSQKTPKDISEINIPYFEPDFSDIKKLINKLKLYITFS